MELGSRQANCWWKGRRVAGRKIEGRQTASMEAGRQGGREARRKIEGTQEEREEDNRQEWRQGGR
jgi:hypothetical protein